jgi:hypothetical protein
MVLVFPAALIFRHKFVEKRAEQAQQMPVLRRNDSMQSQLFVAFAAEIYPDFLTRKESQ